jgi:hypothetical protein
MTSEQNVPEVPTHQGTPAPPASQDENSHFTGSSVPHGMGQSKSSRRRRRKRKTKGDPEGAPQHNPPPSDGNGSGEGSIPTMNAAASSPPSPHLSSGQGQSFQAGSAPHQNGGGGTKRWKKKFRDRDRPRPSDNAGNQASSGSFSNNAVSTHSGGASNSGPRDTSTHQFGNRTDSYKGRKGSGGGGGKQQRDRGPRSFVGPMDHSYRAVNGNFADTPPSTIESGGNFSGRSSAHRANFHSGGDSQPVDYSQGRTIPIADDAPTKIYFFIEDLFFIAKIQETARKTGVKVAFVKNDKESIAALTAGEEEDRPGLIVFDLNNANAKPLTLIPKLKTKLKRSTSIIGFLSHLQGDLKVKATEAGCDTVMPRAAFSQNLPNLLRRYGLEEEEEANFNQ